MNTTEGLTPLCRVLRISSCRVANWFYKKCKSGVQARIIAQKGDKRRRIYKFFMKMAFPDVEKLFLMETKSETVLFIKGSSVV